MEIEFDRDKDRGNIAKHGVSLSQAVELDMLAVLRDDRFDYGEERYRAWGLIGDVAYCLAFSIRNSKVRAISLRRAHKKEMDRYVQQD